MSTIEDKILDGPTINYCDADNDDIRHEETEDDETCVSSKNNNLSSLFVRPTGEDRQSSSDKSYGRHFGGSTNTGPKGVLEDHRKQSMLEPDVDDELDAQFQELSNDDTIIRQIAEKRLARYNQSDVPVFGRVIRLSSGNELLDAIDKEHHNVLVLVHIYTKYSNVCKKVDKSLDRLAEDLSHIKIVTLDASVAGLSDHFKRNGVPALLAYRNTNLIKTIVQLEDLLDKNFDHLQIRELLIDNGLIE